MHFNNPCSTIDKYTARNETNLLDVPNEILIEILKYINIHELSANVGTVCQKLYHIVIEIVDKRLDLRYPNYEERGIDKNGFSNSQHETDSALERICNSKEASNTISYLILQVDVLLYNRYNFYNPAVHFKNSYELLEASDNLEKWEKVAGIGIICPFPTQGILSLCIKRFSNLKYLYMFGEDTKVRTSSPPCYSLLPSQSKLQYIWTHNTYFSFNQLSKWASECQDLTFLKVSGDYWEENKIEQKRYKGKVLCWNLDALDKVSKNLKHLSLSRIEQSSLASYKNLFENISLESLAFGKTCHGITRETLDIISCTQKDLKVLKFLNHQTISKNSVLSIVRNCSGIEKMFLMQTHFKTNVLISIVRELKFCRTLNLMNNAKVNDNLLEAIANSCTKLTSINLSWCSEITKEGIIRIIYECPKLQVLNLEYCRQLSNDCMKYIAFEARHLVGLNISFCDKIDDAGIALVIENCFCLKELNISSCSKLTNKTLINISNNMSILTNLNMAFCNKMDEDGLLEVLRKCLKLKRLHVDFSHCYNNYPLIKNQLTNRTLKEIIHHSNSLIYLILGADCEFSGEEIIKVVEKCKQLKLLDFRGSYIHWTSENSQVNLIGNYFQTLKWKRPNLIILDQSCCHFYDYKYVNSDDCEKSDWEDHEYQSD